jgi:hypothetical protein
MAPRVLFLTLLFASVVNFGCDGSSSETEVVDGVWGGEDMRIDVEAGITYVTLACADGQINSVIRLDSEGHFTRPGTIAFGPVVREFEDAVFTGHVDGQTIVLSITITESDEMIGPFSAVKGNDVEIIQCR